MRARFGSTFHNCSLDHSSLRLPFGIVLNTRPDNSCRVMSSRIPNVLTVSQPIPKIRASTNLRVRLPRPHRDHARHFTTSKPARAVVGKPMIPKGMAGQMPAQQGLKSRMKTVQMGQIPNDLGLMPQTLIRPSSKRLPKLFSSSWKEKLRFEWFWTRTRFQNIFSYVRPQSPLQDPRIANIYAVYIESICFPDGKCPRTPRLARNKNGQCTSTNVMKLRASSTNSITLHWQKAT